MSEPKYDFRDGILLEKVVYKDEMFNNDVDAFFIVVDLEKDCKKLLETLISEIIKEAKINLYFLGYYKSKKDIKITKDYINHKKKENINCKEDYEDNDDETISKNDL